MNENELLLLGLLLNQSQHGYQLNEFIERELAHLTSMKKGNAYATLDRLSKEGFVTMQTDHQGNRPQRKVYSITEAGKDRFYALLRQNLATAERFNFGGDIGLMFMDNLPLAEVMDCLEQRLTQIRTNLTAHENVPKHGHGIGVDLSLEHHLHMQKAEAAWLEQTLTRLGELSKD